MATITREELLTAIDAERATVTDVVSGISDTQWASLKRADGWSVGEVVGHIGDSAYAMALMADRGGPLEDAPRTATGQPDIEAINEQRRQKHATMDRVKIERRLAGGLHETRCVIEQSPDLDGPGPFGPNSSKADWLQIIIQHVQQHRKQLEGMLA